MAEVLGSSNQSQVLDLQANSGYQYTPAFGIYENGNPVRVVLINFVSDPSGNSDLTVALSVGGGQTGQPSATPSSVQVKYLRAGSVSQKGNFTWANQTFGDIFGSDGRPVGTEEVITVQCDQTAGVCNIPVYAPSAAVVFLSSSALTENDGAPSTTFATTSRTKLSDTATIDPSVLATSNGHWGALQFGSTSKGSASAASSLQPHLPTLSAVLAFVFGAVVLFGRRW